MKPKIAFFDFTSCEGCQLEALNFESELLDILNAVEIVNFREAMTERSDDYAIAFVEGSISREAEIPRLKKIREQARVLIALGACASTGCVNSLKNHMPMAEALRIVYKADAKYYDTIPARPISAVVPVDYHIRGCPINRDEFLMVIKALLLGRKPDIPNYPVCVECKQAENICVFEKGKFCLGPVTRAGCRSICINHGRFCWGCRGLIDEPNVYAEMEILHRYGLTLAQSLERFRIFNSFSGVLK